MVPGKIGSMTVRFVILGTEMPGLVCRLTQGFEVERTNVHVGVQRGEEVIDLVPGDAAARFEIDVPVKSGRFSGPLVHGQWANGFSIFVGASSRTVERSPCSGEPKFISTASTPRRWKVRSSKAGSRCLMPGARSVRRCVPRRSGGRYDRTGRPPESEAERVYPGVDALEELPLGVDELLR